MRARSIVLAIFSIVFLWILYLEKAILTPFILAGIFAYIVNPLIDYLASRSRLGRVYYIIFLYIFFFSVFIWIGTYFTKQVFTEAQLLGSEAQDLLLNAQLQIAILPIWMQSFANDAIISIREGFTFDSAILLPFFSSAFSRLLAVITFFFASFYFLKDGRQFIDGILLFIPGERKLETEILLNRINVILGNYLRGQLLLVLLMSTIGFIVFTLLGVRFSLLMGLLIGLAEIVPMIGPIIAGSIVALVATFDGASALNLPPLYDGLLVLGAYVVINQIENYLIVPQLMGKITRLHPLLIFFSVLAGGQLFGFLGFMLAVPITASLRIVLEYILDKFSQQK